MDYCVKGGKKHQPTINPSSKQESQVSRNNQRNSCPHGATNLSDINGIRTVFGEREWLDSDIAQSVDHCLHSNHVITSQLCGLIPP